MAITKQKGDLAEMKVAADLLRMGHRIAFPFGEDWDYDLILVRARRLERVQVKHARSDSRVIEVRCASHSLTNGKVRRTKHYTCRSIDWLAVYDATTDRCFYIPASYLGDGRTRIHLRLAAARNNQTAGVNMAEDFRSIPALAAHPWV